MIKVKSSLIFSPSILILLLLTLANLAIYWPVQKFEFVNLDDPAYVYANPMVREGFTLNGLKWAFTTFDYDTANWHPLTWLSLMLDGQLFGMSSGGYHWTNLLFHIANTLLLFVVLRRMTKTLWRSAIVAVLFAVHPLHIESVAWVAERKDVLYTFFWFLSIDMYVRYVKSPRYNMYFLSLFFFFLGLMAKPMAVTLPFVFLLLDYWPMLRFSQGTNETQESTTHPVTDHFYRQRSCLYLFLEKGPFFALSLLFSITTFLAQKHGEAVQPLENIPLTFRTANAFVSYFNYIGKMLWPHDLAIYYPLPHTWPLWQVSCALIVILSLTFIVVLLYKSVPYLFTGWFWYLGTLVPVIGLVQVGTQAMADRYTYVPLAGLFLIIAWVVADVVKHGGILRIILPLLLALGICACIVVSWLEVQNWQNSLTLFRHTLSVTRENYFAHNGMGVILRGLGDMKGAEMHFNEALRIRPRFAVARVNLGGIYFLRKEFDAASEQFRQALEIYPGYIDARFNLGHSYLMQRKYPDAIVAYKQILIIAPDNAEAHNYLGVALICEMDIEGAIREFKTALSSQPQYAKAKTNLANSLEMKERLQLVPSTIHSRDAY